MKLLTSGFNNQTTMILHYSFYLLWLRSYNYSPINFGQFDNMSDFKVVYEEHTLCKKVCRSVQFHALLLHRAQRVCCLRAGIITQSPQPQSKEELCTATLALRLGQAQYYTNCNNKCISYSTLYLLLLFPYFVNFYRYS